jgi:two-component sensor histidine kinase/PAS domain-containing protein
MVNSRDQSSSGQLRLADAMNAAAPAVWDWDRLTDAFTVSSRISDIYGFPSASSLSFGEFCKANDGPDTGWPDELLKGAPRLSNGGLYHHRIYRADTGETRWVRTEIKISAGAGDADSVSAYTATVKDVTEEIRATYALRESDARLRLAIEAGKMALWEVDLELGVVTNTPDLNLLFGLPEDATPTLDELRSHYAPGEFPRLRAEGATLDVVRERYVRGDFKPRQLGPSTSEDRTQVQAEFSIITPAGVTKRLLYRAQYVLTLEGRPRITGLLVDITERKLAEERLATVARELQHRVKNSITVIQSIAYQSFRGLGDDQIAVQSFMDRLQALAIATDISLHSGQSDADITDIIEKITKPYRTGDREILLLGPPHQVPGRMVMALGMVLNELCTNSVKYGALSAPAGQVVLQWQPTADQALEIRWQEKNGPAVSPSPKKGFGSKLIETLVVGELGGVLDLRFEPKGIICHFTTGRLIETSKA